MANSLIIHYHKSPKLLVFDADTRDGRKKFLDQVLHFSGQSSFSPHDKAIAGKIYESGDFSMFTGHLKTLCIGEVNTYLGTDEPLNLKK